MIKNKSTAVSTATLFLVAFINQIAYNLVIPVLVPLTTQQDHTLFFNNSFWPVDWMHGIAIAAFSFTVLLAAPFIGYFSDISSRKLVLIASMIGTFVGFLLLILSLQTHSFTLFVLGRIIAGACASSTAVVQAGIIDLHPGKDKAKSLGIIALALTLGMVLGPFLGGVLIDTSISSSFTLLTPFIATAILIVINGFFLVACYQEPKNRLASSLKSLSFSAVIKLLPANCRWWIIAFLLLELSWSYYFFLTPMVLNQTYQSSASLIGLFLLMLGIAVCIGLTLVYQLSARYLSKPWVLLAHAIIMLCGLLLSTLSLPTVGYWIIGAIIAMSLATCYVALLQLISDSSPTDLQGTTMGFCNTMMGLAWTISGVTTNILFQQYALSTASIAAFILIPIIILGFKLKARLIA